MKYNLTIVESSKERKKDKKCVKLGKINTETVNGRRKFLNSKEIVKKLKKEMKRSNAPSALLVHLSVR